MVRYLSDEERIALLSTVEELTASAFHLFEPSYSVTTFLNHLAERLQCRAVLYLEVDPSSRQVKLVGSAGLRRPSPACFDWVPSASNDVPDWTQHARAFSELHPHGVTLWPFSLVPRPPVATWSALVLAFEQEPPLGKVLYRALQQLSARMAIALSHRRLFERVVRERTLLESQNEASDRGILMVAENGSILSFNHRLMELWNLRHLCEQDSSEEVFEQIGLQLENEKVFTDLRKSLKGSPLAASRRELRLKQGRTLLCHTMPIRTRTQVLMGRGWSFQEITESKRAEEERSRLLEQERQARAQLEEAVQVRDDFLSTASHELKTPLTPLALRLHALAKDLRRGLSVEASSVEKALASLRKVGELVNHLLDTSRIHSGRLVTRKEPCSLNALIGPVVENFREVSVRHPIVFEAPQEDAFVCGDRMRLEQVLNNLLDNAIKYSPTGGTVRVALETKADQVLLSVSDQGMGVPAEQQKLLFERFFRGRNAPSRNFGGLGLGLYISRDIVERHGGRIWLRSTEGQGATFYVSLPRMEPSPLNDSQRTEENGTSHAG